MKGHAHTHDATVVKRGRGLFVAVCSCGWERKYAQQRTATFAAASHESDARRGHL